MGELGSSLDEYRRAVSAFRWEVPAAFNFGRDVVDRLAEDPTRPALLWRNRAGACRRLSFADVSGAIARAPAADSASPTSDPPRTAWPT
jgi:hypothetical protein